MQTSLAGWLKKATAQKESLKTNLPTPPYVTAIPTPPPESDHDHIAHRDSISPSPSALTSPPIGTTVSASTAFQSLHPNLSFGPITQANLPHLKRINALLLPIPYPTSFYSEIIADPTTASISLAAIWTDGPNPPKLIGGIRCRLLSPDAPTPNTAALTTAFTSIARARRQGPEERMLYISSLTLLSPFRGLGVAKELLRRVEAVARERYGVQTVGAHTWIANEEGRRWYATRGFEEVRIEEGYYRRLEPQAAVVLVKKTVGGG